MLGFGHVSCHSQNAKARIFPSFAACRQDKLNESLIVSKTEFESESAALSTAFDTMFNSILNTSYEQGINFEESELEAMESESTTASAYFLPIENECVLLRPVSMGVTVSSDMERRCGAGTVLSTIEAGFDGLGAAW